MTPKQAEQVNQALAQFAIYPDVDQLMADYHVSIVAGALFSVYGTVRETARMMARADTTVRGHLNFLGIERKAGRPLADRCKRGHLQSIYRKYPATGGTPFCTECKRIRERVSHHA